MNERDNARNNNDERLHSSLSSSVKERAMENEGNQLQVAREKHEVLPQNLSSNGNIAAPRGGGIPNKNSIHANANGIPNKNVLPSKGGINTPSGNTSSPKTATGNPISGKDNTNARGQSLKNQIASKGLQAMGVPKQISDSAVNSKIGKKAMGMAMNPAAAALGGLKNAGKSEAEKDAAEKEEEEEEKEKRTGQISLRVPLKVKLILFLAILPSFTFIILFISIIGSFVADKNTFAIYVGTLVSGGGADTARELVQIRNELVGTGIYDEVGMGNGTAEDFYNRAQNLGNIFEYFECKTEEECLNRDEVKFYIKVNDIATRYKRKYHVTLDWELLMATALSTDLDVKDMFVSFLNEYNYDDVEKYNILMNLDWDYDYKRIPGYAYLKDNDYHYDLQILAKNMVTKTTTQTCSKTVVNSDGSTSVVVTKTQTDTDVEDQYLQPGEQYYLQCDAGESYDISSNYKLDLEKYDEFLLEYIEHKMYLPSGEEYNGDDPNSNNNYNGDNGEINTPYQEGNSLAENMVNLALSQKGIKGTPNKFTKWLGPISGYADGGYSYPWCATFVSWVIANTSYEGTSLKSIISFKSASTGGWARHFRDSSNLQFQLSQHYGGTYKPKQGDLILFTWASNPNQFNPNDLSKGFSHIGIVTGSDDTYVYTIEGNTSNMVAERKYKLNSRDIDGYGVWY